MPNKPARLDDPFKGIKTGSWTKWGGGRNNLIRSQAEPTWACQACGEEQPQSLAGFMVKDEVSDEYTKLCAKCFRVSRKINYSYRKTILLVRRSYFSFA